MWIFWCTLFVGVALVALQGILSWIDGYLSQSQMRLRGIDGWSLLEHGGMWADVFVISPVVAYSMSKYQLDWSWIGRIIVLADLVLVWTAIEVYRRAAMHKPEAHTHHGRTTFAGWVHGIFAVAAIKVLADVYLGLTTPTITASDLIVISILLTPFPYLGVAKFSRKWKVDRAAGLQIAAGTVGLWVLTGIRLYFT